jgi:hypothetical protein
MKSNTCSAMYLLTTVESLGCIWHIVGREMKLKEGGGGSWTFSLVGLWLVMFSIVYLVGL